VDGQAAFNPSQMDQVGWMRGVRQTRSQRKAAGSEVTCCELCVSCMLPAVHRCSLLVGSRILARRSVPCRLLSRRRQRGRKGNGEPMTTDKNGREKNRRAEKSKRHFDRT
jgi:hypothetical protein